MKYSTCEEIKEAFVKDGWGNDTEFSKVTIEEAKDKGYSFIARYINEGRVFFRMHVSNNIYDDTGKLILFGNI